MFSVLKRKVSRPGDFADLDTLAKRLVAFDARYDTTARPFDWTFTRADLIELCRRIEDHEPTRALGRAA